MNQLLKIERDIGCRKIGEVGRQGVICNLYFLVNKIENLESTYAVKWDRQGERKRKQKVLNWNTAFFLF